MEGRRWERGQSTYGCMYVLPVSVCAPGGFQNANEDEMLIPLYLYTSSQVHWSVDYTSSRKFKPASEQQIRHYDLAKK